MSNVVQRSTLVTNVGPFLVSMEHENLCVISIPLTSIPYFSWWLIREYSLDHGKKNCFHSILMDNDGLSVICSTVAAASLESISGRQLLISPHVWRAFVINVAESATEFPGAVHYLADSLSNAGLSILHISTFEYEVFLVQEQDIEKACAVFRLSDSPTKLASVIQEAQRKRTAALNGSSATSNIIPENSESSESQNPAASLSEKSLSFKGGFELCVLPGHVMLARLNDDFPIAECSNILTKLMLYDERFSPFERLVSKGESIYKTKTGLTPSGSVSVSSLGAGSEAIASNRSRSSSNSLPETPSEDALLGDEEVKNPVERISDQNKTTFMWGLWQCENELTFLLDESDVDSFPEGALTVSPQRWRLIKLGGRMIEFHETGIVAAMSDIDPSIPSLNISTVTSNCTLVPEELLERTLDCLSESLQCPVREYR